VSTTAHVLSPPETTVTRSVTGSSQTRAIQLYIDTVLFPCEHPHSNRIGSDNDAAPVESTVEGSHQMECYFSKFQESFVLSVSDCSACFGSQELVIYDGNNNQVLVQIDNFCPKCRSYSFSTLEYLREDKERAKTLKLNEQSQPVAVLQRCVAEDPTSCQGSMTILSLEWGYGWYRPEGYMGCLPCNIGKGQFTYTPHTYA
jgi:hypothetical protein